MSIVYLLLGGNLGNRQEYLHKAAQHIHKKAGAITEMSSVYESPSWGFEHPLAFLNQAIAISSEQTPIELLEVLQDIEFSLGRTKSNKIKDYEARTIDIDIIFYDHIILNETQLCIPHPQIQNRRFALLPLVELIPDFIHPVLQKSIQQLLIECQDKSPVTKYNDANEYLIMEGKEDAS